MQDDVRARRKRTQAHLLRQVVTGFIVFSAVAAAVMMTFPSVRQLSEVPKLSDTVLMSIQIITRNPDVMSGTPVFRGTRVPFQTLVDYLEEGETLDEFLDDFPTVSREMAIAALEHAKALVLSQA